MNKPPYLELSMLERHQPQNATCCIPMSSTNVFIIHTQSTTMLISTPSTLNLSKMQALSLYGQASIPAGIKYVGRTPTTGNKRFLSNIFHKPFQNLQREQEYISTTSRFPFVYNTDHKNNSFIFHPPGKQDHLTVKILIFAPHLTPFHTNNFFATQSDYEDKTDSAYYWSHD